MSSLPLLRPLTIGEILDRAIRIYRSHFVLLISIPLVALVPMTALQVASQFLWHTTALVDLLQNAFLQVLVSSALVVAVSRAYLSHPPTLKQAYGAATRHYGSVWGANLLVGLAIILPMVGLACGVITLGPDAGIWMLILIVLLILPYAIFLGTRWNMVLPGILLEDLGVQAGLSRSWSLTTGSFWKVFGTSFAASILVILLAALPQLAVTYGLGLLLPNTDIVLSIQAVVAQVSLIITLPVSIGVMVVLYYDLRVRKEAFDLEWQVQQISPTSSSNHSEQRAY